MRHFYLLALLLPALSAPAQNTRTIQQDSFSITVVRAAGPVRVDGDLSDSVWQTAPVATNFQLKWPRDGAPAPAQTEVRCAADARYLYFAVRCEHKGPLVLQSLKRDVGYWDSDGFAIVLDPTNSANNGYFFGISAAGVQTDGLLAAGADDMDANWDNAWLSETKVHTDAWTAEYAIPLRILRFREGQTTWGVNFIRNDLANGLYSIWAVVPFQFDGVDLGWTGALHWQEAPRRVKGNVNLIPYAAASAANDYEEKTGWKAHADLGLDAKIGIGSGMNLDLTVNPDFSQVEIDEQVVNLTRFDVMLPEKRTFFLENADIFGNFGIPPIRPFFSRTIGLNDDGEPVPILGGLRLTGNLDSDTRLGVMSIQTGAKKEEPGRNYTAVAARRRLFGRSTVGGYFFNREEFHDFELQKGHFSRNAGAEFNYVSTDGEWMGWATYHHSFRPGIRSKNGWGNFGGMHASRHFTLLIDLLEMGENYYADMGFERRIENYDETLDTTLRIGYRHGFALLEYRIFPKSDGGNLNYTELGAELYQVLNPDGSFNESTNEAKVTWNFKNTSEIELGVNTVWANVPVSFKFDDDTITQCPALSAGHYRFTHAGIEWNSDYRKPVFFSLSASAGGFYTGKQYALGAELRLRFQPLLNLRVAAEYNRLDFAAPLCDVEIFNLTPRVELFFSKNLWWTTFLQYNTQSDNFNVNSRLQWRFRPMSDLFVVYTDNYAVQFFGPKNRALALKLNWWF